MAKLLCAALLSLACVTWVQADTIYLNDGRKIEADVIKEGADKVIVDLGFETLTIPKDRIQKIEKSSAQPTEVQSQMTGDLYYASHPPVAPIQDLAKNNEEAVVMIKTPAIGGCSGFIINEQGYVLTNFHCIEGETEITVNIFHHEAGAYRNQKIENVQIVATNSFLDVALIKFTPPEGLKITYINLCEDDDLVDGDTVFAIGNPIGLERTVSQGIVSKKSRRESDGLLYVQTTTQINPGNSGGPLFNDRGEVVGITNMGYLFLEGLNYAIPIRYVVDFLKNRDAYTYNLDSPSSGHQYIQPGNRLEKSDPDFLKPPMTPGTGGPKSDKPEKVN